MAWKKKRKGVKPDEIRKNNPPPTNKITRGYPHMKEENAARNSSMSTRVMSVCFNLKRRN
jgi:hypothetical protein